MNSPADIWKAAEDAVISGDAATLERLFLEHAKLFAGENPRAYVPSGPGPDYAGRDARAIIAREHEFESFAEFEQYREARKLEHSLVAKFEAAVDAIVSGDVKTLDRLLRENPDLIRARSARTHHSTLLHYVGANGIEGFRQKTPKNAVEVLETLLRAGAEVDAAADMYGGGSTTLGLVATSIHPLLAGVQNALMETLIHHGAVPDGVNGCLANGRGQAAEFLAAHGAPLDFEGAAGVGRLDLVKSYFNEDGSLKSTATQAQFRDGFAWACEFGQTSVVDFLLERGVPVDAKVKHHGQTGLHWAACGGHLDTVQLLLERNAPVDAKDEAWGNTPLGWALHGWSEAPPDALECYYDVAALLVAKGAAVDKDWLADEKIRGDARLLAALTGK